MSIARPLVYLLLILITFPARTTSAESDPQIASEPNLEIRLFLEDHEINSGQALSMVMRVMNLASKPTVIMSGIGISRTALTITQSTTRPDGEKSNSLPPRILETQNITTQDAFSKGSLAVVVYMEGPFPVPLKSWLTTQSTQLSRIKLEQGQDKIMITSTPADVFPEGEYTLRAVLLDGSKEIVTSKTHKLTVIQETPEQRAIRLAPIRKFLPADMFPTTEPTK